MNCKSIISATAFAMLSVLAVPLHAQSIGIDTRAVAYADLDLSSSEGRKTLDRRLALAVNQVCGELSARSALINRGVRECRATTLADANTQRDVAIAQYRARTPGDRDLVLRGR